MGPSYMPIRNPPHEKPKDPEFQQAVKTYHQMKCELVTKQGATEFEHAKDVIRRDFTTPDAVLLWNLLSARVWVMEDDPTDPVAGPADKSWIERFFAWVRG